MFRLIFLEASSFGAWFEKVMATPTVQMIISAVGVIVGILFVIRDIKKTLTGITGLFTNYQLGNKELSQSIKDLKTAKEELFNARGEIKNKDDQIIDLVKDIKALKLGIRLLIQNLPDSVSTGAAKQAIDILKEEDEDIEK